MCTDCPNELSGEVHIGLPQQPYCEQCEGERCIEKIDAACVTYHLGRCEVPTTLPNLGIPSCTSLQTILETLDRLLGTSYNIPLEVVDSPTIDFVNYGAAGHTLTGNVKISADAENVLFARANGLYAQDSGKLRVTAGDGLDYLANQIEPGDDPLGIVTLTIEVVGGKIRLTPTLDIAMLCAALQTEGCLCQSPDDLNIP